MYNILKKCANVDAQYTNVDKNKIVLSDIVFSDCLFVDQTVRSKLVSEDSQ